MAIMPDSWIKKMAKEKKMIEPFIDKLEKKNVLSYGFLLMVMMQEYQEILKYLLMLILQLLIQRNFLNQVLSIEMLIFV